MYDVNDYGRMMCDRGRMDAYTEALRRVIRPESVVVDIGTGLGVFALVAAKLGAKKVYAIDVNPRIRLGARVAARNGYADRIEFVERSVFDIDLPEKADVVVSDCRGGLPLYDHSLAIIARARQFLAPAGKLLPEQDELFATLVAAPTLYTQFVVEPWETEGLDWTPCREESIALPIADMDWLDDTAFATTSAKWASLDYRTVVPDVVRGRCEVVSLRESLVHFICLWFRAHVMAGLTFHNGPEPSTRLYRRKLLPLPRPIELRPGARIDMSLTATPVSDDYLFAWELSSEGVRMRQLCLQSESAERGRHPA